eukprot:NODE_5_length_72347_cov_1.339331.p60 type:complete len:105 gc:universal NODE_5_length_72347_cov_1.339331:53502-53188(-)
MNGTDLNKSMEQVSCLLASTFIWFGRSPLTTIQKSVFCFGSIVSAYNIQLDEKSGNSTALAVSLIYFLQTRKPHIGLLGHLTQAGLCGCRLGTLWRDEEICDEE